VIYVRSQVVKKIYVYKLDLNIDFLRIRLPDYMASNRRENLVSHIGNKPSVWKKKREFLRASERLLASQEGLFSTEFVCFL
jgi:hypothetical protein